MLPSQQSLSTTATLHSTSFLTIHIGDIVYFGNPLRSYVFLGVTAVHSNTDGPVAYEAAYSIPNSGGTPIIMCMLHPYGYSHCRTPGRRMWWLLQLRVTQLQTPNSGSILRTMSDPTPELDPKLPIGTTLYHSISDPRIPPLLPVSALCTYFHTLLPLEHGIL